MTTAAGEYLESLGFDSPSVEVGGIQPAELLGGESTFDSSWALPLPPLEAAPVGGATQRWRAGPGSWYSRFWVLLGPVMPWQHYAMPFLSGPELTLGSTATPREIAAVKKQIIKWKSPHGYPNKVILQYAGTIILGAGPFLPDHSRRGHLTMPFTCPPSPAPYCTWKIGRMMADTLGNMPFISGGYQI